MVSLFEQKSIQIRQHQMGSGQESSANRSWGKTGIRRGGTFIPPHNFKLLSQCPFNLQDSLQHSHRAGLVVTNFLNFCLSFSIILRDSFPDVGFQVGSFFLWLFEYIGPTAFWPPKFLMRRWPIILLKIPHIRSITSLLLLLTFFVFWQFDYNVTWHGSLNSSYLEFVKLLGC